MIKLLIAIVLAFIVLGRIYVKIRKFDEEMDKIYKDELNKKEGIWNMF